VKGRCSPLAIVTLVGIALSLAATPLGVSAQVDKDPVIGPDPIGHCTATLDPVRPDSGKSSSIRDKKCFREFWRAIFEATNGRVLLPRDAAPGQISLAEIEKRNNEGQAAVTAKGYMHMAAFPSAQTNTRYIIGINYTDNYRGGSSYTWRTTAACAPNLGFSISRMPSGWDNRASSAETGANCGNNMHYQFQNFNRDQEGATINCGRLCNTMGAMNDRTSSERWSY